MCVYAHGFLLARVCVCVGARARGRVHVRARVDLLIQHATRMRCIVLSFVATLATLQFSTLYHKRHVYRISIILPALAHYLCIRMPLYISNGNDSLFIYN